MAPSPLARMIHRAAPSALLAVATALALVAAVGCSREQPERSSAAPTGTLTVFHAGSLAVPLRELSERFREQHPGVTVRAEAAGSRDTARKLSDLGRRCDVLASADYRVVENLLMDEHADYNIRFATNEMVIAYHERSRGRDELGSLPWHELLLREDVAFGRSDPHRDPCGYRTVMVFQLAERFFGVPGLTQKLEQKDGRKYVRPKETDLLALLESGELDYLFIYRSVALQHRLLILDLPPELDLGSPELGAHYAQAKVRVTGKRPGESIARVGAPIAYSVTIPKRAERPALAEAYLGLLLSPDGQAIMARNGQSPIAPAWVDHHDRLPAALKPLCRPVPRAPTVGSAPSSLPEVERHDGS